MLEVRPPILHANLTGLAMDDTGHEQQLVRQISKADLKVMSLGTLLLLVLYSVVRQLSFERIVIDCKAYGRMVHLPLEMVDQWFKSCILRLIHNIDVDLMLALVALLRA